MNSWILTVEEKIHELERIASWASQANFGAVRDHCRRAVFELREYVKMQTENDEEYARVKGILKHSREVIQPLIDESRKGEQITGELMNLILR